MTDEEWLAHIDFVSKNYRGDATLLCSAIGAAMFGRVYGWRVLRIVTSNPSYLKYQKLLGIDFKSVLPEETEYSKRSLGFTIVTRLDNFWKVVRGQEPLDSKQKKTLENFV